MTFEELKLAMAVRKLDAGGRDYIRDSDRLEFAQRVQGQYARQFGTTRFEFDVDDVIQMYTNLRKQPNTRVKADIALHHGISCFWEGRGKGQCNDLAEAGHLIPNCRGGALTVENCIIECQAHNNQRRERTIEEYLSSPKSC